MIFLGAEDQGPLGHVLDITLVEVGGVTLLTMHMVTMILALFVLIGFMTLAARSIATGPESDGHRRYLANSRIGQFVEVIVVFLRDEVIQPVLGDNTRRYLPYLLTLFFFILVNNVLGLVPLLDLQHVIGAFAFDDPHWAVVGGTPTGNISVTFGLAIIAFFLINIHGIRENGLGGWAHHLLGGAPVFLAPIMVPVELLSMFIKPAALAIRLFANMLAGHTLMAVLATFGAMAYKGTDSLLAAAPISLISGAFSVAIMFLEVFVAFLQAFIFMFLTAVFLGQMNDHGHHDEDHHMDEAHEGMYAAEVT